MDAINSTPNRKTWKVKQLFMREVSCAVRTIGMFLSLYRVHLYWSRIPMIPKLLLRYSCTCLVKGKRCLFPSYTCVWLYVRMHVCPSDLMHMLSRSCLFQTHVGPAKTHRTCARVRDFHYAETAGCGSGWREGEPYPINPELAKLFF